MSTDRITRIEWAVLEGERPRAAGSNARLGEHGQTIRVPIMRLTTDCGARGWGRVPVRAPEYFQELLGRSAGEMLRKDGGVCEEFQTIEYPLLDLAGHLAHRPVYALLANPDDGALTGSPLRVRCYDTTLYFDDLHLDDDAEAAELIAEEARAGYDRGHRSFKIKVGRGARHLPLEQGTRRDIAIVKAVRGAVGPDPFQKTNTNNDKNQNNTKQNQAETANCRLYWLEEPFHEDPVLYRELRHWMTDRGLSTLIADGEGHADPRLLEWSREGLVDVVQYDIFSHGFTRWLDTGRYIDEWGGRSAPHHYGAYYGNFVSGHLATAVQGFTFVEWDEADIPGIDSSPYRIDEGWVQIPDRHGFGLELEPRWFVLWVFVVGLSIES